MLTLDWIGNFGYSVLRLSTPLIFAGMAAVISKKAGMMNMALEGMMLCAALGGVVFAGMTGNVWIGLWRCGHRSPGGRRHRLLQPVRKDRPLSDVYCCEPGGHRRYGLCYVPADRRKGYHLRSHQGVHTSDGGASADQ